MKIILLFFKAVLSLSGVLMKVCAEWGKEPTVSHSIVEKLRLKWINDTVCLCWHCLSLLALANDFLSQDTLKYKKSNYWAIWDLFPGFIYDGLSSIFSFFLTNFLPSQIHLYSPILQTGIEEKQLNQFPRSIREPRSTFLALARKLWLLQFSICN